MIKIYLTPNRNKSKNDDEWIPISHKDLLEAGLELLKKNNIYEVGRQNLIRFLMDIGVGPYIGTEEELIELRDISNDLINNGFQLNKYIKFSRMIDKNVTLMKILEEGNKSEIN